MLTDYTHPKRGKIDPAGPQSAIAVRAAVVVFPDAAAAHRMVAGLPAAARALRTLAAAGCVQAVVIAPGLDRPDPVLVAEAARLGGAMLFRLAAPGGDLGDLDGDTPVLAGESLVAGRMPDAASRPRLDDGPRALAPLPQALSRRALDGAAGRIVRATGKPGDGIVSRHVNRHLSQACTRLLLRLFPNIRPAHATFGTAALALAMAAMLFSGTPAGLIAGALLFQAASIFDGVDGEIARATFRSSPQGAALDSMVDAMTNLACVAGVAWNQHVQGNERPALAGAAGLVILGLGLWVLGRRSRRSAEGMSFNALKDRLGRHPSRLRQWLTWLTMRDFYALAGAVLIATGFPAFALYAFAIVAAGWLVVVLWTMMREPA